MSYEPNQIYHIYNQGNNRQLIFFNDENYLYFLKKIRINLLPYVDILAYCLMPNHFHILLHTNEKSCEAVYIKNTNKLHSCKQVLSRQIGFLTSHYTKAINKQEARTGSLFRTKTKAKICFLEGFKTIDTMENEYASKCLEYIHQNPVKARLVSKSTDWVYSSALDYAGLRKGTLCNKALAKQLRLL
jgi:putative transposase